MRIYGGHDYYDCALSMGIDPSIVLVRGKSKTIAASEAGGGLLDHRLELKPEWVPVRTGGSRLSIRNLAVVFCGKVYRGVVGSTGAYKSVEPIWSAERARAFVAKEKNRSIEVHNPSWNKRRRHNMTLEEYFTPFEAPEVLRKYMIANKVSVLVEHETECPGDEAQFEVNPFTLKEIGFAKALDPYTAFQELSMWIGGVLGGTSPETVEIKDDKTLIEGHGFDNRISFRGPRI